VVDNAEHVVVIADLFLAGGVFFVLFLLGDLVEHLAEEEEESRVSLDGLLEGEKDGMQLFVVGVCLRDEICETLLVGAMVLGEPFAGAVDVVLWRNGGVFHGGGEGGAMEGLEGAGRF